jgi:HSP20 family protein
MVMERWRPRWGLTPWRPFRELEGLERRFEDVFGQSFMPAWRRLPLEERGWLPAVEIFEKEDKYVVKVELPGMKEEDVDVSVVGDALTIKGERKAESEVKEEDYHCCERSYGSFFRSIALPSNIDAEKVEANYEDGILEVGLPKIAEVKPTKISVKAKKKEKAGK